MRILLIEDDKATADYIAKGLQEIGHIVQVARTGRDGMLLAAGEAWDVIVTDRMLPGPDGLTILRALRASGITTPVLVLTALGEVERRVEGLDAGADDYLAKPFAFSELRARIAALARRPAPATDPVLLQVGDIELDLLKRVVRRNGQVVELLPTEMRLLEFMLLEGVWELNFDPSTNLVEVHVSRLRRKLSQEGAPVPIQTMRGVGYMLGTAK
jgi:two-component system OmpR family response regulator